MSDGLPVDLTRVLSRKPPHRLYSRMHENPRTITPLELTT